MHKTLKTSIVAIALAGGGTIGIGTLASASYGGESPTTETPTDTESVAPQGLQAAPDASTGDQPEGDGNGPRGRHGARNSEAIAEALGMTTEEFHESRGAGQSIADIAAAQGVDVDTVVQAIVDDVEAHLAAEVAEGDITQEEADAKLAGAEEHVTERVNTVPGEGDGHRGPGGPGGRRGPGTDAPVPEAGV